MKEIKINTDVIKLDSFLKWAGIVSMGSEAKIVIKENKIKLNGVIENQRGKKLKKNDIIEYDGETYKLV